MSDFEKKTENCKKYAKLKKIFLALILFIIISIPAIIPILKYNYYVTADYRIQIIRAWSMIDSWQSADFLGHWSRFIYRGFGSAMFLFYAPFYFYLFAILYFCGIQFFYCFKILNIAAFILSGYSMYYYMNKYTNFISAVCAGIIFMYYPYHFSELYGSGQFAEFFMWFLIPPLFHYTFEFFKDSNLNTNNSFKFIAVFALFVITHHTSIFILFPIILIFAIFAGFRNFTAFREFIKSLIISLLISAYFWMPCLLEKKLTWFGAKPNHNFNDYFVAFSELFNVNFYNTDALHKPYFINYIALFFSVIALITLIFKKNKNRKIIVLLFLTFIYGLFFSSKLSVDIWTNIKSLHYLEFPFRFMFVVAFATSALSAFAVNQLVIKNNFTKFLIVVFFYVSSLFHLTNHLQALPIEYYDFIAPEFSEKYFGKDKLKFFKYYSSEDYLFLPVDFPFQKFNEPLNNRIEFLTNNSTNKITEYFEYSNRIIFSAQLDKPDTIIIKIPYFPNWQIYDNRQKVNFTIDENKFLNFKLNSGTYKIKVKFEHTAIRKFAILLSIIGLMILLLKLILKFKALLC